MQTEETYLDKDKDDFIQGINTQPENENKEILKTDQLNDQDSTSKILPIMRSCNQKDERLSSKQLKATSTTATLEASTSEKAMPPQPVQLSASNNPSTSGLSVFDPLLAVIQTGNEVVENIPRVTENPETLDSLYRQEQLLHHHQSSFEDASFRSCFMTGNAYVSGMSIDKDNCLFLCYYRVNLMSKWKINGNCLFTSPPFADFRLFKGFEFIETILDPYDITCIPYTNTAIVTFPREKTMQFFDTDSLAFGESIRLPGEGEAVCASAERIVVRVNRFICIYDISGKHLNTIDEITATDSLSNLPCLHIGLNGNIIYNDRYSIHCMSLDGEIKWTYKHEEENVTQICFTCDKKGKVYVFFKFKRFPHLLKVLSHNGVLLKTYFWDYTISERRSLIFHYISFDNLYKNIVVFSNSFTKKHRFDMMHLQTED
ncbi:unnamed protein product [Mytilus coruscus]|uniref:Uncharacterized protein n=1 Tax=Mytilus coruscus TaxID=42192 RepID=A0A6J8EWM6_MYTCO|nr:unnamed protein product [Mytilus coruscus]